MPVRERCLHDDASRLLGVVIAAGGIVERQDYAPKMRGCDDLGAVIALLVGEGLIIHRVSDFDGLDTLRAA